MTLVPFDCIWRENHIEVVQTDGSSVFPVGIYKMIEGNICQTCGNPYLWEGGCLEQYLHTTLANGDGLFQIGFYYSKSARGRKAPNDILTEHILGAKGLLDFGNLPNDEYLEYCKALAKGLFLVMRQRFPQLLKADAIVPVPNHKDDPKFELKAVGIAHELSRICTNSGTNIPLLECLRKVRNIKTRRLNRSDREEAVEGMFEFDEVKSVKGKKIILLDDMLTAGNVKGKCVDILKQHGAEKVWMLVAGRNTS